MCKEKKYTRRRILLKVERLKETKTCEVREGDTYATEIMGMSIYSALNFCHLAKALGTSTWFKLFRINYVYIHINFLRIIINFLSSEKSAADLCTEEIPAAERKPQTCICFDLETTGLSKFNLYRISHDLH